MSANARKLKFRITTKDGEIKYFSIPDELFKREDLQVCPDEDDIIDQFTGAYDKNGNEIYENDRILLKKAAFKIYPEDEDYTEKEYVVKFINFGFVACYDDYTEGLERSHRIKLIKNHVPTTQKRQNTQIPQKPLYTQKCIKTP